MISRELIFQQVDVCEYSIHMLIYKGIFLFIQALRYLWAVLVEHLHQVA
jgi:hypothetical protein